MSLCDDCIRVTDIPECVVNLTIGTILPANQPINIYFESIGTGRYNVVQGVSDGAGLVVADLTTESWVMSNHPYKVYVIDSDTVDQSLEDITLADAITISQCYLLEFAPILTLTESDFTFAV